MRPPRVGGAVAVVRAAGHCAGLLLPESSGPGWDSVMPFGRAELWVQGQPDRQVRSDVSHCPRPPLRLHFHPCLAGLGVTLLGWDAQLGAHGGCGGNVLSDGVPESGRRGRSVLVPPSFKNCGRRAQCDALRPRKCMVCFVGGIGDEGGAVSKLEVKETHSYNLLT